MRGPMELKYLEPTTYSGNWRGTTSAHCRSLLTHHIAEQGSYQNFSATRLSATDKVGDLFQNFSSVRACDGALRCATRLGAETIRKLRGYKETKRQAFSCGRVIWPAKQPMTVVARTGSLTHYSCYCYSYKIAATLSFLYCGVLNNSRSAAATRKNNEAWNMKARCWEDVNNCEDQTLAILTLSYNTAVSQWKDSYYILQGLQSTRYTFRSVSWRGAAGTSLEIRHVVLRIESVGSKQHHNQEGCHMYHSFLAQSAKSLWFKEAKEFAWDCYLLNPAIPLPG